MPLFYVSSDPGKVAPRIVPLPLSHPSARLMESALRSVLGVEVVDLTRIDVPDARDGHGAFYFWQGRAVGTLLTVVPFRTVKHLIEDGLAQRLRRGAGRSGGASAPLELGEPVELLRTWASGGATGKNSKAWIGGYVYDGERVVRGQVLAVVRRMKGTPGVTLVSPSEVRRATGVTRESW